VPRSRLELSDLRAETERAQQAYTASVDQLKELADDVYHGKCSTVRGARRLIAQFLDFIRTDADLLPAIIGLKSAPEDYLYEHGMNVALLAITTAAQWGIASENVLEIGVGALLQDVGMLRVPEKLRFAPRSLSPQEIAEVCRHPIYTRDYLTRLKNLSQTSMLVAYQAHERLDGSGYPHRHQRTRIHPFARIVATADTYAAIISHRPHRNARSPYEAMEILLKQAGQNLFDRDIVRHFLDCMSLFPIGSYVRLSNGSVAKVLRANPGLHTKPCVILVNTDGSESDEEVDLARAGDLHVLQALRGPEELALPFQAVAEVAAGTLSR
jgi:HD-GYP domain-containing protein (c-di-GMP phosphodiesterase class II)